LRLLAVSEGQNLFLAQTLSSQTEPKNVLFQLHIYKQFSGKVAKKDHQKCLNIGVFLT
jgi:hypothetical protein